MNAPARYFEVTTQMQGRCLGYLVVEGGIVVEWFPVPELDGETHIRDLALGKSLTNARANLRSYGVTEIDLPAG